jgi:hypothetical protein
LRYLLSVSLLHILDLLFPHLQENHCRCRHFYLNRRLNRPLYQSYYPRLRRRRRHHLLM